MTKVEYSCSPDSNFVGPKITSYVYYPCEYCGNKFQLVQPNNDFSPGGASKFRRRNPDTNEIAAIKNRAQGVCMACAKEIMRRSHG
jgi:DNA-directed RNA polymerase subunit RPC12/RpoP